MATEKVTKVRLDRKQTALIEKEGCNGIGVVSGTVDEIGALMSRKGCNGCKVVFSTQHAPNLKRCFNSYVKRALRISAVAGVTLSDPTEYSINGFPQSDKWVMEVI